MEYSIVKRGQEISAEGVVYDKGSVYGKIQSLKDLRKARGKRYNHIDGGIYGKDEWSRYAYGNR